MLKQIKTAHKNKIWEKQSELFFNDCRKGINFLLWMNVSNKSSSGYTV